eukprot:CAMPEP_0181493504 /NCGR_PEP_ID=MMETSP1110-20121109/51262_1 /TAXON_ID=174948 /ORGANISM="Symbiodinium sp., Strain CCMP421" /LENGTH=72 /DNA_ID=CAMNT_0023620831 /DNA_START=80 /DNA_END=293 /DNA_ORIENTATION=-
MTYPEKSVAGMIMGISTERLPSASRVLAPTAEPAAQAQQQDQKRGQHEDAVVVQVPGQAHQQIERRSPGQCP